MKIIGVSPLPLPRQCRQRALSQPPHERFPSRLPTPAALRQSQTRQSVKLRPEAPCPHLPLGPLHAVAPRATGAGERPPLSPSRIAPTAFSTSTPLAVSAAIRRDGVTALLLGHTNRQPGLAEACLYFLSFMFLKRRVGEDRRQTPFMHSPHGCSAEAGAHQELPQVSPMGTGAQALWTVLTEQLSFKLAPVWMPAPPCRRSPLHHSTRHRLTCDITVLRPAALGPRQSPALCTGNPNG